MVRMRLTPMPDLARSGCVARIRSSYAALTPRERAVADYVLDHPDVVYQSVTAVARCSGTGLASVVRFCKRLGCAGFQDFKIRSAADSARLPVETEAEPDGADTASVIASRLVNDIRSSRSVLDDGAVDRAVAWLARARQLRSPATAARGSRPKILRTA